MREISIHYEHRERNFVEAVTFVEKALASSRLSPGQQQELEKRLERLQKKLAKLEEGEATGDRDWAGFLALRPCPAYFYEISLISPFRAVYNRCRERSGSPGPRKKGINRVKQRLPPGTSSVARLDSSGPTWPPGEEGMRFLKYFILLFVVILGVCAFALAAIYDDVKQQAIQELMRGRWSMRGRLPRDPESHGLHRQHPWICLGASPRSSPWTATGRGSSASTRCVTPTRSRTMRGNVARKC